MTSLFVEENEAVFTGGVSGNSVDPVPSHSASEAAFQISVGASVAFLGGTALELTRWYLRGKEKGLTQIHITQDQLQKAQADMGGVLSDSEKQ